MYGLGEQQSLGLNRDRALEAKGPQTDTESTLLLDFLSFEFQALMSPVNSRSQYLR